MRLLLRPCCLLLLRAGVRVIGEAVYDFPESGRVQVRPGNEQLSPKVFVHALRLCVPVVLATTLWMRILSGPHIKHVD